ncbi:hypothetical protein LB572_29190 [Mesorhizobium sp. BH1-1-5]|uniref:hypothetical protein n=1 Tax=unclassified Mesorhizobium TaxID=325217 RepID=UPI00112A01EB|nr:MULTISPECIES: hypothetical protein [unclassified Mesorhizobium]MBZ9991174.1 hypothetical protein [Mesorhizobium sp. BH1-1-5]TPJ74675.1 hypothetical protein FJ471_01610 [Mesorhizobium sp. B2-7-1]
MAQPKDTSKPAVKSTDPEGLPHPHRDAQDSDAGATPTAPKTAGAREPSASPLDNRVANRNAGRRPQAGPTPRPTDKPLD